MKLKCMVKVIFFPSLIRMLMDSSLVTSMYCTLYYANFLNKYAGAAGLYMRTVMKVLCFGDDCFLHNKIWTIFLYSGSILNKSVCYVYVVFVITIVDVYDYINYFHWLQYLVERYQYILLGSEFLRLLQNFP
jgi:hypothetical protein